MKKEVGSKTKVFNKLVLIFFIGCFVGWIYEEIFYLIEDGYLVNRGFLYGPYLPVYGLGSLFIYLTLGKLFKHPTLVFILAALLTGVLEYFTGFWMNAVYHTRWWDYTGLFLNLDGYVCLRSILTFSIGALFLIYVIVPFLNKYILKNQNNKNTLVSIALLSIFFVDLICTLLFRY